MSIHFKKSRVLWPVGVAAVLLLGPGSRSLKAQSEMAKTPQEAAQNFGKMLAQTGIVDVATQKGLRLSQQDYARLGIAGTQTLFQELQKRSRQLSFDTTPAREENGVTVIEISPTHELKSLPLVIVSERGGYSVDLVATYVKTFQLGQGDYQKKIFELTGVVLSGLPNADSEAVRNRVCRENLKQLQLALLQYAQDHDDKYPPASQWTDALQPYVRNREVFNCPTVPGGKWGYAFNANLSEQPLIKLQNPAKTTAFYETSDLRPNASGTGEALDFRHKITEKAALSGNAISADGQLITVQPSTKLDFNLVPPIRKMRH